MSKKMLLDLAILLALAILGVVGYKLAPMFNPKTDVALPLSGCNLSQHACTATLPDGGQLEFSIEPRPIPSLKPLKLQVTLRGSEVRKVEVDFAGTDMKMGYNRPELASQAGPSGANSRFTGQAVLPVCITGTMDYEATVLVETSQKWIAIPFRFSVSSE